MNSMLIFNTFFLLFSILVLLSAFLVIKSDNPIYSVLFLISVFFNSGLLLLLLNLEFFAFIFIIIYIGAITVLFLFIIMMLNIKQSIFYINKKYYLFISGILILFFFVELFLFLKNNLIINKFIDSNILYIDWFHTLNETSNMKNLGNVLYTFYFFFIGLASLILLVAMIGAIVLTIDLNYTNKRQLLHKQVNTRLMDSVFFVN